MKCPLCQYDNPDTARFCNNCGSPLTSAVGALREAPPAPRSTLATPTPTPRSSEGERKLVTVLFADVADSTAMAESLDPEQVTDIMNGAFAFLNVAVTRYGGTVARLMGDAVLAFFGAPVAHEDDPERAVRAGLEIQHAAGHYAQEVQRQYRLDFNVRVGINTGLAVLDLVGDQIRTEYTAMGDSTNLAARMQSAATPGTVLVSADTYRLVKNLFDFNPRGEIEVKGKSAPVQAYEVIGPKETPGTMRGLEGLASPLVGRDAELRLLREKLDALQQGRGAFVALIGEAGLGKSRLVAEARTTVEGDSHPKTAWLEGRAISYGQSISYYPWRQIIRQSIGAREADPPDSVREKLKAVRTNNYANLPDGDAPFLEAMLAVETEETLPVLTGLGDVLVQYITQAVRGHIGYSLAQAQGQPAVLVFDDLHWADQASLDLLLNICDLVESRNLLIICLLRPEKGTASWSFIEQAREKLGEYYAEISLEPLSAANSQELLGNLLHIEDLPDSVRDLILEKAEGNPFFVEEVIRSLIDSRHIVRENGDWRAKQEIVNAAIPDTLAGVLGARIDRLPGDTKRVTQAASVVGRIFAHRVLKTICEEAPPNERIERLERHLDVLGHEELVRERARDPELEFIFKHALTQEAAYNSLLIKRRKEYHRRTAGALEQLYPERLDELAPTLALHYWHAEDWERAADYSIRAGAGAAKVHSMRAAIANYWRAIEALGKMPDEPLEPLYDALMGWVQAAFRFTPYDAVLAQAERAISIARYMGDRRRLVKALHWTANVHLATGRVSRVMPVVQESFALVDELGDESLTILPNFVKAFMRMDADPRGALAELGQVTELAQKYGDKDTEAIAQAIGAMVAARLGEFEQSQEAMRAASQVVRGLNSPMTETDVDLFTGWSYLEMGDPDQGLEYGQRAIERGISTDKIECICNGYSCVGFGFLQRQNLPEAIEAFHESIRRSRLSGAAQIENTARTGLALAEFLSGRVEAVKDMESTLENARAMDDPYTAALLSQTLGESYTQLGDLARAEGYLRAALDYYRPNGMRPYVARALQSLAALYDKQGRGADAAQARSEAEELAKALQAP